METSLLDLVCCPETHQPLRFATPDELPRLANPTQPLEAALLREDGRVAYPIRNGIPLLVIDEQINCG
jgi:uncharacterized protein YbaR (Trm112 family)